MPTGEQNIFALVKIFPGGSAAPHFHKGEYYPYGSISSSSNERRNFIWFNPQSRKWTLTINNPQDCGLDRDGIRKILNLFCRIITVWRTKRQQREHFTPIFLFTLNPYSLSTVKTVFPPHT
ncbi:MAG: hypothetical protein ACLR56_02070 [Oscillospiraceae bacterium]